MLTLFSAAYSLGGIFVPNRTEPVLTRALSSSFSHSGSEVSILTLRVYLLFSKIQLVVYYQCCVLIG